MDQEITSATGQGHTPFLEAMGLVDSWVQTSGFSLGQTHGLCPPLRGSRHFIGHPPTCKDTAIIHSGAKRDTEGTETCPLYQLSGVPGSEGLRRNLGSSPPPPKVAQVDGNGGGKASCGQDTSQACAPTNPVRGGKEAEAGGHLESPPWKPP